MNGSIRNSKGTFVQARHAARYTIQSSLARMHVSVSVSVCVCVRPCNQAAREHCRFFCRSFLAGFLVTLFLRFLLWPPGQSNMCTALPTTMRAGDNTNFLESNAWLATCAVSDTSTTKFHLSWPVCQGTNNSYDGNIIEVCWFCYLPHDAIQLVQTTRQISRDSSSQVPV